MTTVGPSAGGPGLSPASRCCGKTVSLPQSHQPSRRCRSLSVGVTPGRSSPRFVRRPSQSPAAERCHRLGAHHRVPTNRGARLCHLSGLCRPRRDNYAPRGRSPDARIATTPSCWPVGRCVERCVLFHPKFPSKITALGVAYCFIRVSRRDPDLSKVTASSATVPSSSEALWGIPLGVNSRACTHKPTAKC